MDSIWGLIALACGLYCMAGYWKMIKIRRDFSKCSASEGSEPEKM